MISKGVAILGSTGSIGQNALRVIDWLGRDRFKIVALGCGSRVELLAAQIERYQPRMVSVATDAYAAELVERLGHMKVALPVISIGVAGLVQAATHAEVEVVISATVGAVGFVPTLRALEAGKRVALANKETLVMAGELMRRAAEASGAEILPVDSEHNALHQCLRGEQRTEVRRLVLTASGGPFRTSSVAELEGATVAAALRHPTWRMGDKITIDSATLMNKGLEVIEAHWLFGFGPDEVDILVHPESVVHSMIELIDGSVIAQMGVTDMRHAIQYALTYPERCQTNLPALDLARLSSLHFETPDVERFPCVGLAYRALRTGGTMPAAMNAANEIAVKRFMQGAIGFCDIPRVIGAVMDQHAVGPAVELNDVLNADSSARAAADAIVVNLTNTTAPPSVVQV